MTITFTVRPLGDSAILVEVGDRIDPEINWIVRSLAAAIERTLPAGRRVEVTPAYASLLVSFDLTSIDPKEVEDAIREAAAMELQTAAAPRRFTLPVCYGGDFGPDLDDVARVCGLSVADVVELHCSRDYPVYCLGFSPGFPFLGGLDPALITPRLETPRVRVPAGSVGIAGNQTGVYPTATPGGWRLIGRCPTLLFDVTQVPPVPYRPGDVISFRPISRQTFDDLAREPRFPESELISGSAGQ